MSIKDETVICLICQEDKPLIEIAKAYIIKGEKVYLCKGCQRIVKDIPDDDDFHHQF